MWHHCETKCGAASSEEEDLSETMACVPVCNVSIRDTGNTLLAQQTKHTHIRVSRTNTHSPSD